MTKPTARIVSAATAVLLSTGLLACESSGDTVLREVAAGECVAKSDAAEIEFEAVDCDDGDTDQKYLVEATIPVTEGEGLCNEQPNTDWPLSLLSGDPLTACMRLLPEPGECFRASQDQYWGIYHNCADGGGALATGVREGTSADVCDPGEQGRIYDDGTVLCFALNSMP